MESCPGVGLGVLNPTLKIRRPDLDKALPLQESQFPDLEGGRTSLADLRPTHSDALSSAPMGGSHGQDPEGSQGGERFQKGLQRPRASRGGCRGFTLQQHLLITSEVSPQLFPQTSPSVCGAESTPGRAGGLLAFSPMEDIWEGAEDDFQDSSCPPTQPCPLYSPQATGMTDSFPNILPQFSLTLLLFSLHALDSSHLPKTGVLSSRKPSLITAPTPIPISGPLGSFNSHHLKLSLTISGSSPVLFPPPSALTVSSSRSRKGLTHLRVPKCPTQGQV